MIKLTLFFIFISSWCFSKVEQHCHQLYLSKRVKSLVEDDFIKFIDLDKPSYYAEATLDDGTLKFDIELRTPNKDRSENLYGRDVYKAVFEHFGNRIKRVKSSWVWGDHLEQFNISILLGKTPEEAVRDTWVWEQVGETYDFSDFHIVNLIGDPGEYTMVVVEFEKPTQ